MNCKKFIFYSFFISIVSFLFLLGINVSVNADQNNNVNTSNQITIKGNINSFDEVKVN